MDSIEKTPEDQFNIFAFFDGDLEENETIESFDVYSGNTGTGLKSTSVLIGAEYLVDQHIEIVLLAGQVAGERHKVTVVAYTNQGNTYEKDVAVIVREISIGTFQKQSSERFQISLDFSPHMDTGDTLDLTSIVVSATLGEDGSDVKPLVVGDTALDTTSRKVVVEVLGGVSGNFIVIDVQIDCVDQVLSLTKTFKRTVSMSILDDGFYGDFAWDTVRSAATVLPGESATVAVDGSGGPFTWSVSGAGYTMDNGVTAGLTNTLNADLTVTAQAVVTVTNANGDVVSGKVAPANTSFDIPGPGAGPLAFDGENLLSFDLSTGIVYQHDGISSTIKQSFFASLEVPKGLAFDPPNVLRGDMYLNYIAVHVGFSSEWAMAHYPFDPPWSLHGMCVHNGNLISASGAVVDEFDTIRTHSKLTETITNSFDSPGPGLNDLAMHGDNLMTLDRLTKLFYEHSGITPTILNTIPVPSTDPAGFVVVGGSIISCDDVTKKIYIHNGMTAYAGA